MQYTASSFAKTITGLFAWGLRPILHRPRVAGLFPAVTTLHSHVDDAVLDRLLVPAGHRMSHFFSWFFRFQQGLIQHYVLYILITLILMLGALISIKDVLIRLFAH